MPDNETVSPRKPRGTRKASASHADDWPEVATTVETAASAAPPPERQRIAKAMARAGLCSRRDAEAWILAGRVSVNGEVLASPARDIGPDDAVEVDGAPLPTPEKTRLFLFHKPRGLVTSDHDPEGRETIFDHLREHWPQGPRVVTVGRLDINTEGLLLLTNDGGLARMLELPKTGWLRRYRVRANGETDQAQLDALTAGITLDGVEYAGIEAKLDRQQGANCWLTMGLREGKNREIKRVLEHLGLEVNRLIRLSFGPFQLLELEEGKVEEVRTRVLRDQLGAALATEAGVDFGDAPAPEPEPARIVLKGGLRAKASRETKPPRETKPAPEASARGRAERPARAPARRESDRSGERPIRRREATPIEPREQSRPRRHVSTLRSTEAEAARSGPRKRIERTDTRDRHDRTIAVERKVAARPAGVSPSAEGKRARIARSGGGRRPESDDRRDAGRGGERGAPARSRAPFGGGDRREARPARADGGAAPRPRRDYGEAGTPSRTRTAPGGDDRREARSSRPSAGERPRPRREDGERTAPARTRPASGGERRDARPARSDTGERPRARREDSERAAPARTRSAPGGERRDARPARSAGGERSRAPREEGARAAPTRPRTEAGGERRDSRPARNGGERGDRPERAGARPPRRSEAGERASKPRSAGAREGSRGGDAVRPRGAGTSGKGRPAAGGKPGGRPAGKPPRGGAPGRTKR